MKTVFDEIPIRRPEWIPGLPVVSIVTPNYNYGHFLETCIRSVLGQTYPNIEYIVMDGKSTDHSCDIIRQYESKGITRWISEKDAGQTDAINKGFALTSGHIFTWLNSDDAFAHPEVIREVVSWYQQGYTFIVGETDMIDSEGRIVQSMQQHGRSIPVTYQDYLRHWKVPCLPQPSVFVARDIAATAFPLSKELYTIMDYQYLLRCLKENPTSTWVPSVWVRFVLHEFNKTGEQGQEGRNTDAEYDHVFEAESCYLETKDRQVYLKELRAHIALRTLRRQAETDTRTPVLDFLKAAIRYPKILPNALFWKLLLKKLIGKSFYQKLFKP